MKSIQQITSSLGTMFNHFHRKENYQQLSDIASHLNNNQGCLISISDGDDMMGGSLRNVLFTNIDQVLAKHLKLKSKSKLKEDQVEILEAFKKNLETYTFDRYQTK
jgi:hypothetical protein